MTVTLQEPTVHPYIAYLQSLASNRGALAALRKGLSHPDSVAPDMFPYVVRWLPEKAYAPQEEAYYLTAALFALHPQPGGWGNFGRHMVTSVQNDEDRAAVERRFVALLKSHPDDLHQHLRHAVSFLKSKEVAINWQDLFVHLQSWSHPDGWVQKEWARGFWGYRAADVSSDVASS